MICKNCKNRPAIRGIDFVKCIKCGKDCSIMYGDFNICEDCSNVYGICKRCGEEVRSKEIITGKIKVLYDSETLTIDFIKNYDGLDSIRLSYFKDNHWVGESWIDNVFSQENSKFRKDI